MRHHSTWRGLIAAAALITVAGGCSASRDSSNECNTTLDYESEGGASVQSPATGVLTFSGEFYSNESVILGYTDDTGAHHAIPITPSSNRTSLSFAGLPSGTRTFTVTISCDAGQDVRNNGNFTVK